MDPGRKSIEWRDSEYVAVGDLILTEHGVEWEVEAIGDDGWLVVRRQHDKIARLAMKRDTYRVRVRP